MLRGLRHSCPLSLKKKKKKLPLYVIQSEITTQNISKDKNIIGLTIPNQKKLLKILQYADILTSL